MVLPAVMSNEFTIGSVALPGHGGVFTVTVCDGSIAAIRPAEQAGEASWLALPVFAILALYLIFVPLSKAGAPDEPAPPTAIM